MKEKGKLLVVDDDQISREIIGLTFEKDFQILEASNGLEALEVLKKEYNNIVCIILDLVMPVMDGMEFLRKCKEIQKFFKIPILISTAATDMNNSHETLALGVADFIYKPLDPDIMRIRVQNVLSNFGIGYAYNDYLQREFLDLLNTGIRGGAVSFYMEPGHPIFYMSQSLAKHLGYVNQWDAYIALNGMYESLVLEEDYHVVKKSIQEQILKKKEYLTEYRVKTKDGAVIWFRENGKISKTEDNRHIIVALCMDITDVKNAEEAYRISEKKARYNQELARIALEGTKISIWEYSIEHRRIVQWQNSIDMHGFGEVIENVPEYLIDCGFIHKDDHETYLEMYRKLIAGEVHVEGVYRVQTKDRNSYWYEYTRYTNTFDEHGRPYKAVGISEDVTENYEVIEKYNKELKRKSLSPDVLHRALINVSKKTLDEYQDKIGDTIMAEGDIDIHNIFSKMAFAVKENQNAYNYFQNFSLENLKEAFESGRKYISYEFLKTVKGHSEPIWVSFEAYLLKEPDTQDLLAYMYIRDVDEAKREKERLVGLAECDSMTGLLNHDTTFKKISEFLQNEGRNGAHVLFVIDLDDFKQINDVFGHQEGDEVIKKTAKAIKNLFRADDIVGRVGGDEFMVLMKDIETLRMVHYKAIELCSNLEFTSSNDKDIVKVCSSIGVTIYYNPGTTFEQLYKEADTAMYVSKRKGKKQYTLSNGDDFILSGWRL